MEIRLSPSPEIPIPTASNKREERRAGTITARVITVCLEKKQQTESPSCRKQELLNQ